jgi:hypothetical protein
MLEVEILPAAAIIDRVVHRRNANWTIPAQTAAAIARKG